GAAADGFETVQHALSVALFVERRRIVPLDAAGRAAFALKSAGMVAHLLSPLAVVSADRQNALSIPIHRHADAQRGPWPSPAAHYASRPALRCLPRAQDARIPQARGPQWFHPDCPWAHPPKQAAGGWPERGQRQRAAVRRPKAGWAGGPA